LHGAVSVSNLVSVEELESLIKDRQRLEWLLAKAKEHDDSWDLIIELGFDRSYDNIISIKNRADIDYQMENETKPERKKDK